MARLGVNIDHVATLREVRHGFYPEPKVAAQISEKSGADSIVIHLREDRRHIREVDLCLLKKTVKTKLNLEMSTSDEIVKIALKVKPDRITLVPEKRQELTTEGGLDVVKNLKKIEKVAAKFRNLKIGVSLFIDPSKIQVDAAEKLGLEMIELHTGRYANAKTKNAQDKYFDEIAVAADYAKEKGINVFAGHGLDYANIFRMTKIKIIEEFNIGYSIICRAVLVGLAQAVREMKILVS